MGRQAYRRRAEDQWERIDQDCRTPRQLNDTHSFEAIHGLSEKRIYAVGRRGEIWLSGGTRWTQQDSPTNRILTGVLARNGSVLACGMGGTLVERTAIDWEPVEQNVTDDDFRSACEFKGRTFLSTLNGVHEDANRSISPVDFGDDAPGTFFCLSEAEDNLWSIGAKIFSFDGTAWTRIV